MLKKQNNIGFIDGQNLNMGIKNLGWSLDFKKFRVYLREKYSVQTAYIFIGYVPSNQDLYSSLQKDGYVLVFKPTIPDQDGNLKGNVDADLVLHVMLEYNNFEKAVIVTSDGDYYSLIKHLYKNKKLEKVISPHINTCSSLLKKEAKNKIIFINNLKRKLEYKKKNTA